MNKFSRFFVTVVLSLFAAGTAIAAYNCEKCYVSCNQGFHLCSGTVVAGTPCTTTTGTSACPACVPCAGTEHITDQSCGCPAGQHWGGTSCVVNCQLPMILNSSNECVFDDTLGNIMTLQDSVGTLKIPVKMMFE